MSDQFLEICEGVKLILAPCMHNGFNLKPGMLLFDADTTYRHLTGFDYPFVAVDEFVPEEDTNLDYLGRPITKCVLDGYKLVPNSNQKVRITLTFPWDYHYYDKLLSATDLVLGEDKLYNLFIESKSTGYERSGQILSVYDDKRCFYYMYLHVIGNIYLQRFMTGSRDKLVTLSVLQALSLNSFKGNYLSQVNGSELYLEDDNGLYGFLRVFFGDESKYFDKEYVDSVVANLHSYFIKTRKGKYIDVFPNSIGTAYVEFTTDDGFNIKPCNLLFRDFVAEKYLYIVNKDDNGYNLYDIDTYVADDGLHNVYLTGIHRTDNSFDCQLYDGFYFDGERFKSALFAVQDHVSSEIDDFVHCVLSISDMIADDKTFTTGELTKVLEVLVPEENDNFIKSILDVYSKYIQYILNSSDEVSIQTELIL